MDKQSYVNKILALFAKAESTTFPEEADALLGKAQELMTRHAIDEALLSVETASRVDEIETVTIRVDAPYAKPKSFILNAIVEANGCKAVYSSQRGYVNMMVTGFSSDLRNVESLFAQVVMHALRDMLRAENRTADNARSFRASFLYGFSGRLSERLRAARRAATAQYEEETGSTGAALVLADREREVEAEFRRVYPRTSRVSGSVSSRAGVGAGRESANGASLGQSAVRGGRVALNA